MAMSQLNDFGFHTLILAEGLAAGVQADVLPQQHIHGYADADWAAWPRAVLG